MKCYEKQYADALIQIYDIAHCMSLDRSDQILQASIPGLTFKVDVDGEFPILHSKLIQYEKAEQEVLQLWKQTDRDSVIGHRLISICEEHSTVVKRSSSTKSAYTQVSEYLSNRKNDENSIKCVFGNILGDAKIKYLPMLHSTDWVISKGQLNLVISQCDGELLNEIPHVTTQYAMLMIILAKLLDVKPGILTHTIANAWVNARNVSNIEKLLNIYYVWNIFETERKSDFLTYDSFTKYLKGNVNESFQYDSLEEMHTAFHKIVNTDTRFIVEENIHEFLDVTTDNAFIRDYEFIR